MYMSNRFFSNTILNVILMMALVMLNATNAFGDYTIYALGMIAILAVVNAGYMVNAVVQEKKQTAQHVE